MLKRIIVVMIAVLLSFSLVAPGNAQVAEDVEVDNVLGNVFGEGDVLRLKMKDTCFGVDGKKVNLKLRKKTEAVFGEDGDALVSDKNGDPIGFLNLDVKGRLVSGSKEITLKGKGKVKGNDYYCVGAMFGKIKKVETKEGHFKTTKGFDCECCFPLNSSIVQNYLKNQAEEDEKQTALDKCQKEYDACIDTNKCCSEKSDEVKCSNCYNKYMQCNDDVNKRFSKEDTCGIAKTDAEEKAGKDLVDCYNGLVKPEDQRCGEEAPDNISACVDEIKNIVENAPTEPCGEEAPDNISACVDTYNAAIAQIEADEAICRGDIEGICSSAHKGDLSRFTEDGLLCKSKWTLKYRNRFQTSVDDDDDDKKEEKE